jgi:hypothetical protein
VAKLETIELVGAAGFVYRSPLHGTAAPKVFLNLGDAEHVSLADAREHARQSHSIRELGKHPKVERECQARVQQQAPTVEELSAGGLTRSSGRASRRRLQIVYSHADKTECRA